MNMRFPVAIVAVALLAGCASPQAVNEIGRAPAMSPIGSGLAYGQTPQMALYPKQPRQVAQGYSLWSDSQAALFKDARALNVGDILTVQIDIDDSAKTTNNSSSSRTSGMTSGFPHLLGLESSLGRVLPGGFDPANAIETSAKTNNSGSGAVNRAEKISLTVAAVVSAVLPNGNLVIQGTQEVRTNNELRQLTVAGIVRPEDISSANTIKQTQIAEARISYGGRGDISRVQKTPYGQALVEKFQPF